MRAVAESREDGIKRAFDIVATTLGLLLLGPVILLSLLLVRVTSPGSALFTQVRVGRYGRPFKLYKVRSMYLGTACLPTHAVAATAVTPIGALLRRTKLDELPQFLNVLKGEMSLVGPRPCLPTQTVLLEMRMRVGALAVKPGLTGPAQVQKIDMSDPARLAEIDGRYAMERTLLGDASLIVCTLTRRRFVGVPSASKSKIFAGTDV